MHDLFEAMTTAGARRVLALSDERTGLRALLVIDDLTLGPAAGGVRTRHYPSLAAALADAAALARAMTVKCAVAGLPAGGAKVVVLQHPGLDRAAAFEVLGERVEELGGLLLTAGDLGTTTVDLQAMARHTRYVYADEAPLAVAAGRGILRCVEQCATRLGRTMPELSVAVQGCGTIGGAAARALAAAGARCLVSDLDAGRAAALAAEVGGAVCHPAEVLTADVDVLSPCAVGGALTEEVAGRLRARAVCGGANNVIVGEAAERRLVDRGVLLVPDVIASAGAVAWGVGERLMGLSDPGPLVDALGDVGGRVLDEAERTGELPGNVVRRLAAERLAAATREA